MKVSISLKGDVGQNPITKVLRFYVESAGSQVTDELEEADILVSDDIALAMKALAVNEKLVFVEFMVNDHSHKSGLSSPHSVYRERVLAGRVVTDVEAEDLSKNLSRLLGA